jgi:DHA3 family tetracycline resistance protein-like MFS transporter
MKGPFDALSGVVHTSSLTCLPVLFVIAAKTIYLATSFVWGMLFWTMATVFMVYLVEVVNLGPLQLVLVGTALEVSAFLFEVPTGIVADTYSRRLSVVLGYLITGVAFMMMGLIPDFAALLLASFLWGIGWTFISGAHQAWLADEIGETEAAATYLKGARVQNVGAFLGIVIAVTIGSWQIHYPIILSGGLFFIWGVALIRLMPETGFRPGQATGYNAMVETFHAGVGVIKASTTLMLLMLVGIVFGTFSEGYDRLGAAHLLRDFAFVESTGFSVVVIFGAMAAAGTLLAIGVVALAERFVDTNSARQLALALSMATTFIILCVVTFALAGYVWLAIAMYILLQPLRSVIDPLTMAWFNRNIPSSSRATVISMHSQSDALGQIAGGPAVGLIGREFSVRLAITVAGVLLLPALWLYARALTDKEHLIRRSLS